MAIRCLVAADRRRNQPQDLGQLKGLRGIYRKQMIACRNKTISRGKVGSSWDTGQMRRSRGRSRGCPNTSKVVTLEGGGH